jgi:hypothetical protein
MKSGGRSAGGPTAYVARLGLGAALCAALVAIATPAFADAPIISVWYRGSPAGQPRLDDLAAIKALGFTGVTWPGDSTRGIPELRRMADIVGLTVVLRPERRVTRPDGTGYPTQVDVPVSGALAASIPARAWRAVAHGARVLSFDHGEATGTGTTGPGGGTPAWVAPAVAIARQLSANAKLVDLLRHGPPVKADPSIPGVDVVLLDAGASWVIAATNTSPTSQKMTASLPPGTPYAIWISWIDGTDLAMLSTPQGPRWTFEIGAGKALVYLVGKVQR